MSPFDHPMRINRAIGVVIMEPKEDTQNED